MSIGSSVAVGAGRKLHWWLLAATCLVVVGLLGWSGSRSTAPPPVQKTVGMGAVCDLIAAQEPAWFLYPASGKGLQDGVYVSDHAETLEQLARLTRNPDCISHWSGIVIVSGRLGSGSLLDGDGCMRIGRYVLFGDNDMVERLQSILKTLVD